MSKWTLQVIDEGANVLYVDNVELAAVRKTQNPSEGFML